MRRPRKHLEVSTFPFLAVLLCAMGSLILILMVFDRRAKLAANERNRAAAEALLNERNEEIARLKSNQEVVGAASNEKEMVASEKLEKAKVLKRELTRREEETRKQLLATQKKWEALDQWVKESKERVVAKSTRKELLVKNLEKEKKETNLVLEKASEKQKELARLAGEIAALKKLLEELKAAGPKPNETWSIIPYFGKKGESRKPIYVECQANSFVFHPGKVVVEPTDPHRFRDQVLLRSRVSQMEQGLSNASIPPQPYLLLLVRPDGIETFWKSQAILKNDKVDFGYELIDGDWKLEFPDDSELTKALRKPSLAGGGNPFGMIGRAGLPGTGDGGNQGFANGSGQGLGLGDGGGNGFGGPAGSRPGFGGQSSGAGRGAAGNEDLVGGPDGGFPRNGSNGSGSPGFGPSGGSGSPGGSGVGIPDFPKGNEKALGLGPIGGMLGKDLGGARDVEGGNGPIRGLPPVAQGNGNESGTGFGGTGNNRSGISGNGNDRGGNGSGGTVPGLAMNSQGGGNGQPGLPGRLNSLSVGGTGPDAGMTGSGGGGPGGTGGGFPGGSGPGGVDGSGGGTGGSRNLMAGGSAPGGGTNPANGPGGQSGGGEPGSGGTPAGQGGGSAGQNGPEGQVGIGQVGGGAPGGTPGNPNGGPQGLSVYLNPEKPEESQSAKEEDPEKKLKKPSSYSVGAVSGRRTADEDDLPDPYARVAVPNAVAADKNKKEPRPLRVARLDGNREFIIFIECDQKGLTIHPEKQKFAGHELETEEGAKRLLAVLRKQIDRKTKNIPAGEPVPKGKIRFLVWPDGLRWYHASFPIVEELDVPKSRQSLDPDDKIRDILLGN